MPAPVDDARWELPARFRTAEVLNNAITAQNQLAADFSPLGSYSEASRNRAAALHHRQMLETYTGQIERGEMSAEVLAPHIARERAALKERLAALGLTADEL